jgi:hypothetical protein
MYGFSFVILYVDSRVLVVLNVHLSFLTTIHDYPLERKVSVVDQLFEIAHRFPFILSVIFNKGWPCLWRRSVVFSLYLFAGAVFLVFGGCFRLDFAVLFLFFDERVHK